MAVAFIAATALISPQQVISGELEPPSGPAPTMHSLDEIYDKLIDIENTIKGGCTDCTAPIPQTGQKVSEATGDDGDKKIGVVSPIPRFTDNENGTVTDNLTGLIWMKDAGCGGQKNWADALNFSNNLASNQCGLDDGSSAGDWRLPNIRELQSLIDYGNFVPALPTGNLFTGIQSSPYWSSTSLAGDTTWAWYVQMFDGISDRDEKIVDFFYVWCVRGPQ